MDSSGVLYLISHPLASGQQSTQMEEDLATLYNGKPIYNFVQSYEPGNKKVVLLVMMPQLTESYDLKGTINEMGIRGFIYVSKHRERDDGLIDQIATIVGAPEVVSRIQFLLIPTVYQVIVYLLDEYPSLDYLNDKIEWTLDRFYQLIGSFEVMADHRRTTILDLTRRIRQIENKYRSNRQQVILRASSVRRMGSTRVYINQDIQVIQQTIDDLKQYIETLQIVGREAIKLD